MLHKMSFWLFKPTQLLSYKNILPYKIENSEEFLNFLTLLSAVVMYFSQKRIDKVLWQKILIILFATILILGSIIHMNTSDIESIQGMEIPKYANFSHSLIIT